MSDKFISFGLCVCVYIRKNIVAKCEVDYVVFCFDDVDFDVVLNEFVMKYLEFVVVV